MGEYMKMAKVVGSAVISLLVLLTAGCQSFGPLRIKPVAAAHGAVLEPHFQLAYYRVDRAGMYHFYLQATTPPTGTDAAITQIAIIRVLWKPIPGVTPILHTAINATFRYLVITPSGAGMYQGAGFIRIHNGPRAPVMHASVVAGDLRLTGAAGYFRDALGPSRIVGNITAVRSGSKTLALTLGAQREFYLKTYRFRQRR